MSAEKTAMKATIRTALSRPNTGGSDMTTEVADQIASAVDTYVLFKLGQLKIVLATPGAFMSPGGPTLGPCAPGAIAGYTP